MDVPPHTASVAVNVKQDSHGTGLRNHKLTRCASRKRFVPKGLQGVMFGPFHLQCVGFTRPTDPSARLMSYVFVFR